MSYFNTNRETIRTGFKRLTLDKDTICLNGMIRLAEHGFNALLDAHEIKGVEHHISEWDTLAWAVVHNGKIERIGDHLGNVITPNSAASSRILPVIAKCPQTGWVAVIFSEMSNAWYNVDYEWEFLEYSETYIRDHFRELFKPLR